MYKLKKLYDGKTVWHNVMGPVTFYKEADQALLAIWHKFMPECVTYKEVKPIEVENNDSNKEGIN